MKPFNTFRSTAVTAMRPDIDTDIIIPADYLKTTSSEGLGKHLFERVRAAKDPDFTSVDQNQTAQILITGDNFGCGSSREHAVWALSDAGYRVVIAPSFANIFYNNALNNGFLPVELNPEEVTHLAQSAQIDPQQMITVDLPQQKVICGEHEYRFEIDPYKKTCFLKGMTDLDYLLAHKAHIDQYNADHAQYLFVNLSALS